MNDSLLYDTSQFKFPCTSWIFFWVTNEASVVVVVVVVVVAVAVSVAAAAATAVAAVNVDIYLTSIFLPFTSV